MTMAQPPSTSYLESSQTVTHYTSNGVLYPRIRYGDDNPRWGEVPCGDCGARKGEFHAVCECQYEHCPVCRASQLGTCPHTFLECGGDGVDVRIPARNVGDRIMVGVLVAIIALSVLATMLGAFRVL